MIWGNQKTVLTVDKQIENPYKLSLGTYAIQIAGSNRSSTTISFFSGNLLGVIPTFFNCRKNERHHEKTNILVSDLVPHKPGCTVTEDG